MQGGSNRQDISPSKHLPESPDEIRDLIDKGDVLCAIQINRGFGKDLQKGIPTEIQVIVDGTDSNTALIAMSYVNTIIGKYSLDMMGVLNECKPQEARSAHPGLVQS